MRPARAAVLKVQSFTARARSKRQRSHRQPAQNTCQKHCQATLPHKKELFTPTTCSAKLCDFVCVKPWTSLNCQAGGVRKSSKTYSRPRDGKPTGVLDQGWFKGSTLLILILFSYWIPLRSLIGFFLKLKTRLTKKTFSNPRKYQKNIPSIN